MAAMYILAYLIVIFTAFIQIRWLIILLLVLFSFPMPIKAIRRFNKMIHQKHDASDGSDWQNEYNLWYFVRFRYLYQRTFRYLLLTSIVLLTMLVLLLYIYIICR